MIIATALNLTINYFLIPKYGALGAAVVSLITNFFVGIIYYINNSKLIPEYLLNTKTILFIITSFIFAYIYWIFKDASIFITIPIVLTVYSLLIGFFYFSKEEMQLIISKDFNINFIKNKSDKS